MTRFEKDIIEIEEGNEIEVLKRRKAELEDLYKKRQMREERIQKTVHCTGVQQKA